MATTSGRGRAMHPVARQQRLEVLVGILGFFTLASFVVAVAAELRGRTAVREALVLALFVLLLAAALRWRRRG